MKIREILGEAATGPIPTISKQEALDRGLFGPVYHGSNNIETILKTGFDPDFSRPTGVRNHWDQRPEGTSNGMSFEIYGLTGNPAPIHWLGFGVYFTTSKSVAKQFNGNSTRGLREFYLDVPRMETINFGSPNTMMKWWMQNGFDPAPGTVKAKNFAEWYRATDKLTDTLKSKYDAVWYKGKGMFKLLDGDQVVVFDGSKIYMIDPKLSSGLDIGAKVRHNQKILHWVGRNDVFTDAYNPDNPRYAGWRAIYRVWDEEENRAPTPLFLIPPPEMVGTIVSKRPINPEYASNHGNNKFMFDVKWKYGGTQSNYYESELIPLR